MKSYLLILLVTVQACVAASNSSRPNLIFMMADQLRWDALGYAATKANPYTPNLDKMASESLVMKYSWSTTPTCTPARAALLTGQSSWNHGMLGYGSVADWYPVEMPRVLRDSGYKTVSFGKDHFGWNATSDSGIAHGYDKTSLYDGLGAWDPSHDHQWSGEYDDYDQWFQSVMPGHDPQATLDGFDGNGWNGWRGRPYVYDEYYHPTAWLGRQAISFLESYDDKDTPFFLKVSFHRPHSPYDPPQRMLDKIDESDLPPIYTGVDWDDKYTGDGCGPSNADAWCGKMPDNETLLSRRCYYASVSFVDEQIGLIFKTLEKQGLLDNTYVLFTADHGDGQSDHWHWRKGYPYEFSAHVPMLFRWPDSASSQVTIKRGTVIDDLMSELRDVFHTFVDAGQATSVVPNNHFKSADGKSLLCLLKDPTGETCDYELNPGPWRQWIDLEHAAVYNESNHWSALTDGEMKYIFYAPTGNEQLFNLTADPDELHELSTLPAYKNILALWRQRMVDQFEMEGRGPDWVQNGTLQIRTKNVIYGPNFPHGPTPKVGDPIVVQNDGAANGLWQKMHTGDATVIELLDYQGNVTNLCILGYKENLVMAECNSRDIDQLFTFIYPKSASKGPHQIMHTISSTCIALNSNGTALSLQPCSQPGDKLQTFGLGESGRMCATSVDNACITAYADYPSWHANNLPLSLDHFKY